MKKMKRALRPVVILSVAMVPASAFAQADRIAPARMAPPAIGKPATVAVLSPSEIFAAVQRAGFDPISRPVQRGNIYVLFALDRQDRDVRVTVDAASGRVLSVTGIAGTRFGSLGFGAYEPAWRYGRPPVPPADIPYVEPFRDNAGPIGSYASKRYSSPLPRPRPADVTGKVAKDTAPPAQAEPPASAAAPSRPDTTAATRPTSPAMVPVAPLY